MNKLGIGENIYNLRKEQGLTQSELAELVGVSTPAVCKWEGNVSYPDIALLPRIARIFTVTIDELLNYRYCITKEEEEAILVKCRESLIKNSNNNDLCFDYIRKYPLNYSLKLNIAILIITMYGAINGNESTIEAYKSTLFVFKDISDNCTENDIVSSAMLQLSTGYRILGDYEKALEILNRLNKNNLDVTLMLSGLYSEIGEVDNGRKVLQEKLYFQIYNLLGIINNLGATYSRENYKKHLDFSSELVKVLEKEGLGSLRIDMNINYLVFYAKNNMKEKCKETLLILTYLIRDKIESNVIEDIWLFDNLKVENLEVFDIGYKHIIRNILEMNELKFLVETKEYQDLLIEI